MWMYKARATIRDEVVPSRISKDRTFFYILYLLLCILPARARRHIDVHLQHRAAGFGDSKQMTNLDIE